MEKNLNHLEQLRDHILRRIPERRVETIEDAYYFIEEVGFCHLMTDGRDNMPSLYVAVCGRRDVRLPRNVQSDAETSLTWHLKDELARLGAAFYAKQLQNIPTFIALDLVPYFYALYSCSPAFSPQKFSSDAIAIYRSLRRESPQTTAQLKLSSGIEERKRFDKALEELQLAMQVVMSEVRYVPKFTYVWELAAVRFPEQLRKPKRISRQDALRHLITNYLATVRYATARQAQCLFRCSPAETGRALEQLESQSLIRTFAESNTVLLIADEDRLPPRRIDLEKASAW